MNDVISKREEAEMNETTKKASFSAVSIVGVSRVANASSSYFRRITWATVLLTCTCLMTYQVYDRVAHYLSVPVNVKVQVTRNKTLEFPVVSFCNKNMFNMSALRSIQLKKAEETGEKNETVMGSWLVEDLIGTDGLDARDIWNMTKHNTKSMIKECWFGRGKPCDSVGTWESLYSIIGVCYQYRHSEPVSTSGVFNNMYLRLTDREKDRYQGDRGFKIHIHDPRDNPVIDLRTHGLTLEEGWTKDIRITVREFKTINTQRRPCVKEESYSSSQCILACFLTVLQSVTNCSMPYMTNSNKPTCNSPEEYKQVLYYESQLLFYGKWSSTSCGCEKQCNEDIYSAFAEVAKTSSSAKLRVFFQDLTYNEVHEELAYEEISLLCDIGGTLGLLLGASVLTVIEITEAIFFILCRKFKRRP